MFETFRKPNPVIFEIEGQPFKVLLPTRWNKEFSRAVQTVLSEAGSTDDAGKFSIDRSKMMEFIEVQKRAFLEHCLLESPIEKDELASEYPALLDVLFDAATERAELEHSKVDEAVGKLRPTSVGSDDGKVKSTSTTDLKSKAA